MANSPAAPANRLARETSPYLLQHAGNPVDWYPWGEEALARARAEGKPILLSIGYSACHWCHVMAHESFEHEPTARVMNDLFVNVKLDREERPDLDKVYQVAHQVLTQRGGGWPLTMFLDPDDLVPFFGGTYFPRDARYGLPGFADLLQRVAAAFAERRADLQKQNVALRAAFDEFVPPAPSSDTTLSRAPLDATRAELEQSFDPQFGGTRGSPKFPHAASIDRLLRHWHSTAHAAEPDLQSLYMASLTLTRMAEGGLYDQIRGGFFRYSVDAWWMIPHFEKMLYDNGPLLALYADAAVATGDPLFRRVASETADWALAEMRSPTGGFWSTLDADSEGHEGRFYVWDAAEVAKLLSPDDAAIFARRFGLDRAPNFEGEWHLHGFVDEAELATEFSLTPEVVRERLARAGATLLAERAKRIRPGLDDKVLTAWNGLMIRGLAIASRALGRADLADRACEAVDFLRQHCWIDGELYATWKDGQARFPGYLDDYVLLADALVELLGTRFRAEDLAFCGALLERLLEAFGDEERGGFWFTASGRDTPLGRSKTFADDALPSGNGVAARVLARYGWLTGETRWLDAAEATLKAGYASLTRVPSAHAALATALDEWLVPGEVVILRGEPAVIGEWQRALAALYAPKRLVIAIPSGATGLPPSLADKRPQGPAVAYVCQGPTCAEPITTLPRLVRYLRDGVLTGE